MLTYICTETRFSRVGAFDTLRPSIGVFADSHAHIAGVLLRCLGSSLVEVIQVLLVLTSNLLAPSMQPSKIA